MAAAQRSRCGIKSKLKGIWHARRLVAWKDKNLKVIQPITTVFHDSATGYYGYMVRFDGSKPHYTLATCLTLQDALDSCDPHREHIWEEASDADEGALLVSRAFKGGSVSWRMANLSLEELTAQRAAANATL
jgi:hypothetical protein